MKVILYITFVLINLVVLCLYSDKEVKDKGLSVFDLLINGLIVIFGPLGTAFLCWHFWNLPEFQKKLEKILNMRIQVKK